MKRIILILIIFVHVIGVHALEINADLFTFDEETVNAEFEELDILEAMLIANPEMSANDLYTEYYKSSSTINNKLLTDNCLSGMATQGVMTKYFWTSFVVGAVGTFFIYGAVAGPIAVAVIYFTTDKNVTKTKQAAWGCAAGTLLGIGAKLLVSAL